MNKPNDAWAITDATQAVAALRRVLAMHCERPGDGFLEQTQCMADDFSWPCPTIRAITETPSSRAPQPEPKMCVHCARRGTRGFYESADGPACSSVGACTARVRRYERWASKCEMP